MSRVRAKDPNKLTPTVLLRRSSCPEPSESAGPERDLCQACGAYMYAKAPFMKPYIPERWTGKLLIVGERPGQDEDTRTRRPFTGPAGKVLSKALRLAGFSERDAALTNAVRCAHPRNAPPSMLQLRCCRPLLLGLIYELRPEIVIAAGSLAARGLLNRGKVTATGLRGRRLELPERHD